MHVKKTVARHVKKTVAMYVKKTVTMHVKKLGLLIALFMLFSILAGCSQNGIGNNSKEDSFTVVTSFYPIYLATINVTKDIKGVETINMTKPQTGCLHDYQLTPEDLIKIEKADAFVANGAGMEAFIGDVLKQQKNLEIIDASQGIELIKDESGEENLHVWFNKKNEFFQPKKIAEQLSSFERCIQSSTRQMQMH